MLKRPWHAGWVAARLTRAVLFKHKGPGDRWMVIAYRQLSFLGSFTYRCFSWPTFHSSFFCSSLAQAGCMTSPFFRPRLPGLGWASRAGELIHKLKPTLGLGLLFQTSQGLVFSYSNYKGSTRKDEHLLARQSNCSWQQSVLYFETASRTALHIYQRNHKCLEWSIECGDLIIAHCVHAWPCHTLPLLCNYCMSFKIESIF